MGLLLGAAFLLASHGAQAGTGRAPPQAQRTTKTVLVMGDSLSAAYGMAASKGWVSLLDARLRKAHPGWTMVNASVSGETTAGGVSRLPRQLDRVRPAVVIIELGANDGLRGLPLDRMRANLDRMIRLSKASGAKVLLVGMRMPPNLGRAYTDGFANTYTQLARQHQVALLPFFLEPIMLDRGAFQRDNLHPTEAAQAKLANHVWPALQPLVR
jgi:acyl-CoA thioesterase-1